MCDACSRNTWKKVKCWIHCSLSCIQLLSWPVHRWFRGNYTGHIYVLHFFTMKVVWVDPAKKKNTCFTNTMNGPVTDLVLPRVFAILRGPRHFYFWRRSPTKSSIFCSWNHLHMLDKIARFPMKSQGIVLKSGGTSRKSSKTPAIFPFFPIFSYFFPFFPGEMLQILHSLWVVPWVFGFCQAFFEAIEVNAVDAWTLFDSLDADGDHLVSYEDFPR